MPSTRRQKAKARRSREADIMSDIENMDVLIGNPNLTENRLDFDIASERSYSLIVTLEGLSLKKMKSKLHVTIQMN